MNPGSSEAAPAPQSLARGIVWSGLAQGWSFGLSLVSVFVMARLLAPREYAVMAIVTPIVGVALQVQAIGLGSAIIHAREVSKQQLSTLFWLMLGISVLLAGTLMAMAPGIAGLFSDPRLAPAVTVAAMLTVTTAIATLPGALLMRNLRFRETALQKIMVNTFGTGATIALAWYLHTYWALIAGLLVTSTANLLGNVGLARWLPGRPGSLSEVRSLLQFGRNIWAANLFVFISRNADNLIVASVASERQLGLYDRAYRVMHRPLTEAVGPLGQVLIPTLTRAADDEHRYRTHYWRAVLVLLLALHPVLAIAVVNPVVIVGLLLGPEWIEVAPIFTWFAVAAMSQTYLATLDWLLISQGRSSELMRKNLVTAAVALASFVIGIEWGVLGLTVTFVLGQGLLCAPFTMWLTGRKGLISVRGLWFGILPHALALMASIALVWSARRMFGSPLWPELIATGLLAYAVYAVVLLIFPDNRSVVADIARRARALFHTRTWRRA